MRRCDCSTKMTATTTSNPMAITTSRISMPFVAAMMPSEFGNCAAIEVKIISDMPLPMPRSVMSSPNHMITPVPAVMVMTIRMMPYQVSPAGSMSCEHSACDELLNRAPRAGHRDEGRRLQDAQRDGQVARVLGELGLTGLALLVERVEVGDDHAQQLHDDRRRDVRHDPQREDRQLEQGSAAEQVDQVVQAAGGSGQALQTGLNIREVDERRRDERAESEQRDDAEREPDLPAEIGCAEDPRDGTEHDASG